MTFTETHQYAAEVEIERLGFDYTLVPEYDLERLSEERRVQVREDVHYAPKETVARFTVQMGESIFPPIVVTSDDYLVDGNTRVKARHNRKERFCPALVVDVDFAGAKTTEKHKIYLGALAATLNSNAGQGLTPKEARAQAADLIRDNWTAENIGRALGLAANSITQVRQEIGAAEKLAKVGMDDNGDLKGASLRALGNSIALNLNDGPYRELAVLAGDAGLNANEVKSVAKEVKELGSDAEQLARFSELRTEMAERIASRKLTGVGKPPMARQLRQHLGFVTKFFGREAELLETDPNVIPLHVDAIEAAMVVLGRVAELQQS